MDEEIKAMSEVLEILKPLDSRVQARILDWAKQKLAEPKFISVDYNIESKPIMRKI